jgi:hypothetical protein
MAAGRMDRTGPALQPPRRNMLKKELMRRSPIRILEQSIHGGLGKGNLGVFTARKGVGKTACLVHVSIDKILRGQKVLHISFAEDPRHIETWYDQVFREISRSYQLENIIDNHDQVIQNRKIMHFRHPLVLENIRSSITNFTEALDFYPEAVIVDGFSFYDHDESHFRFWKNLAGDLQTAVWFSASLHREKLELDDQGIPAPVNHFKDFFSVIIMLRPHPGHIDLDLLKDHENKRVKKLGLELDTGTMLIVNNNA